MKQLTFLFLILICGSAINAQRTCGNEINSLKEAHLNPHQVKEDMKAFKEWQKQRTEENRASIPVTIPVHIIVVHGLFDNVGQGSNVDMERINSQIQVLNDDFARTNADAGNTPSVFEAAATEISFCLATIDPDGNPTDGVTRYATGNDFQSIEDQIIAATIWPPTRYLNIYLAPDLPGLLGYSSRPTPGNLPATNNDVVRVLTSAFGGEGYATEPAYDEGRTSTHEIGHWLGLRHVWGNGGCNSDDGFEDTPDQTEPNYGCPSHPSPSCSNGGDMFMNYMDYVNDNCMNSFSQEQADYMSFIIEGTRTQLINSSSTACIPNGFPIVNIASLEDVICPSEQTGRVEINATSGTPPYTFSLNGGTLQADGIFQNLPAGDHEVAVTESEGRTTDIAFTINEPETFVFTNSVLSETCTGQSAGAVEIETSGGNSTFPDLQVFGGSYNVTQKSALEESFEQGLPVSWVADAGWTFGDASSLSSFSFPFPVTDQFMAFNDDALGENHVGGGSVYSSDINLNGATNFKLIFDVYFFDGDYDGANETAKLFLSNNNGASWEEYVDFQGVLNTWVRYTLEIPSWDAGNVKLRFAYDDGGGWNYGFGIDNIIVQDINYGNFSNLPAGTYTVRATDANDCNYEESFTITNTEPVSIASVDVVNANCSTPGQVSVSATSVNGISEYQLNGISNATGNFDNLPVGTYDVVVLDNLGCSSIETFEIMDVGQIMLTLNSSTDVNCAGLSDGSFDVGISGAVGNTTISVDGQVVSSASVDDLAAGDYTVDVVDDNGCAAQLTVTINEPSPITFTGVVTDKTCSGPGSISQSATGGSGQYTFSIVGAVQTAFFDNLEPGTYIVTTMDDSGCVVENTFEVLDLSSGFDIIETVLNCSTEEDLEYQAELCSSDGSTAEWVIYDNQGVELFNAGSGNCVTVDLSSYLQSAQDDFFFGVEASAGAECIEEYNGVAYHPIEFVLVVDLPITICEGELYSLDPSNNTDFSDIVVTDENGTEIEQNGIGIFPIIGGTYNISYTDVNGCRGSEQIEVFESAGPSITIDSQTDATSSTGGSIEFSSDTQNTSYQLNFGQTSDTGLFEDLPAGDYSLTAFDENGCQSTLLFTINLESAVVDFPLSSKILIHPNPTMNQLFIELENENAIDLLSVHHANGRKVLELTGTGHQMELNTNALDAGLYFIRIRSGENVGYRRFLKL